MHSVKRPEHSLSFRLVRNPSAVVSCIAPSGKSQWSDELKNLNEYRQSGTPGDFAGAVFLVLFYAKKVLRGIRGETP
jgi:hypothetical protein